MKTRSMAILVVLILLALCLPAMAAPTKGNAAPGEEITASLVSAVKADVSKVKISGSHTVKTGQTIQLKAAITPSSASQKVTWSTSDKKIAKVNSSGKVTGIKAGKVTITATSKADTKKKATWKITVKAAATKVTISGAKTVTVGNTITLKAKVLPATISQDVTWTSSNTKVATVSNKGVVTGIKAGKATITATSKVTKTRKATLKITVAKAIDSIEITGPAYVARDCSIKLESAVKPSSASQSVTWISSKPSVASVSDTGWVTGIKAGTVTITAASKVDASKKATIKIKVMNDMVSGITFDQEKVVLYLDSTNTAELKASASPASAAQSFTWMSSDNNVAAVSEKGKVTGLKPGEATITATAVDGSNTTGTVTVLVLDFTPEPFAKDFEYYTYSSEENTCYITKYIGSDKEITIPKVSTDGMTVVGIGDRVFENNTDITSVTVQETLQYIGRYAFRNCSSLTSITIPSGLITIWDYAFQGCIHLTSVDIPGTVGTIKSYAFSGCTAMTDLTIGEGVSIIEYDAFGGCTALTGVSIPSSVANIGSAFKDCTRLSEVSLAEGLNSMSSTFSGCTSLKAIVIPSTVTEMPSAFSGCISLKDVTIMEGVKSVSGSTFYGCKSLKSITIPGSVDAILSNAFEGCTTLSEVIIQEGINSIGYKTFYDCTALRRVELPSSLVSIDSYAFANCKGLQDIELPEGLVTIGSYAFQSCFNLQTITIPSTVITIDTYAFNAAGLKSFIAEEGLVTMKNEVLENCGNLNYVRLPDSLVEIGWRVFYNCSNLSEIHCPAGSNAWDYALQNNLTPVPTDGEEADPEDENTASEWVYPAKVGSFFQWNAYSSGMASSGRPYHVALDLGSGNEGETVVAAATGTVTYVKNDDNNNDENPSTGNGNQVVIEHVLPDGSKCYSFYAHLKKGSVVVSVGDLVKVNTKIAEIGHTGSSSNGVNHCHFSIVDTKGSNFYGYVPNSAGDTHKNTYQGVTFYDPVYVIENVKLP